MSEENFECETAYATEEQYLKQSERIKKQRPLSKWEKEDIFFVRWFTLIVVIGIVIIPIILIFGLNMGICVLIFLVITLTVPPTFFFRKEIYQTLKEKISYWWNMVNGRFVNA